MGSEDEEGKDKTPSAALTKSLPSEDQDELWGKQVFHSHG